MSCRGKMADAGFICDKAPVTAAVPRKKINPYPANEENMVSS